MGTILNFIYNNINTIIWIAGIGVVVLIIVNSCYLFSHKSRINDALNRKKMIASINKETFIVKDTEEKEFVTPETMIKYEKDFNKACSLYNMYTQWIPIFPLLGILGTVSGLMLQVEAENIDELFASLHLALESTWLGLLFSIGLKFFVALIPAKIIYDVEILIDDYDKKFNTALAQKNISEE